MSDYQVTMATQQQQPTNLKPLWHFTLGLLLLLGGTLWLQTNYLLWGEWSFDQGHYLLVARLMNHGYQPYSQIFMSEPPLMSWSIGPSLALFGSVAGMQLVMVGYGLIAVAALVSIGASLDSRRTGLLAGMLLAFSFTFFFAARKVMPEVPAMGLGLLSMAAALRYRHAGRQPWLWLSGISLAASVQFKYFMPWLAPLILLVLSPPLTPLTWQVWRYFARHRRRIALDWAGWIGAAALTTLLASLSALDLPNLIDQTIFFHIFKEAEVANVVYDNPAKIWGVFVATPVFSLLALAGVGIALARFQQTGWIVIAWLGLTLAFLLIYTPLRSKHMIVLAPVSAMLAALPLSLALRAAYHPRSGFQWRGIVLAIVLFSLLGLEFAWPYQALAKPNRSLVSEEMQPLLALLGQFTNPDDCLITDNPYLAFEADRMPPPWIANLSYARFTSGSINTQELIDISQTYNCQVMAPILDRIKNSDRAYYDWAKGTYLRVWVLDGKEIMLGKPLAQASPAIPLDANFAGQVQLSGADWRPAQAGGFITLYWHTLRRFEEPYKIFVQLRDASGQTVANADHEAYNGLIPTQFWPVGAIFKETNRLTWPADLAPGSYTLYVGLYHPANGERLPISDDSSGENAVIIPGIVVP